MRSGLAMIAALGLAGCAASGPRTQAEAIQQAETEEQSIAANVPSDYRLQIADDFKRTLKDPYSIRDAEITKPGSAFIGLAFGGHAITVCARLNAKNSFGGYTGQQNYKYIFREKRIAESMPAGPHECIGRPFGPFPEVMPKNQ